MRRSVCYLILLLLFQASVAHATIFRQLRGVVHDLQHRPVSGVTVTIRALHSDFTTSAQSSSEGTFSLPYIPLGDYTVEVLQTGFAPFKRSIALASDIGNYLSVAHHG